MLVSFSGILSAHSERGVAQIRPPHGVFEPSLGSNTPKEYSSQALVMISPHKNQAASILPKLRQASNTPYPLTLSLCQDGW